MLCNNHEVIINRKRHIWVNKPVFQENKIHTFKIHLLSFYNTKKSNVRFFQIRLGTGLIR